MARAADNKIAAKRGAARSGGVGLAGRTPERSRQLTRDIGAVKIARTRSRAHLGGAKSNLAGTKARMRSSAQNSLQLSLALGKTTRAQAKAAIKSMGGVRSGRYRRDSHGRFA